jgi:hypothetical protein
VPKRGLLLICGIETKAETAMNHAEILPFGTAFARGSTKYLQKEME